METLNCLVCGHEMASNNQIKYTDHYCTSNGSGSHLFVMRIRTSDHSLAKLTVRFVSRKETLCFKVHYDEGYSEAWTDFSSKRFRVNQIVIPDFTSSEKMKNKIRMLLVFG